MLLWLSDRSQAAADFAQDLPALAHRGGNNVNGNPVTVAASGLTKVYAGEQSADYFGVPQR